MAGRLIRFFRNWDNTNRHAISELHEWECKELQHIFALLVLGSLTGLPAAPTPITLELLPDMEEELILLMDKISTAHDPLGELFSLLDGCC